MHPKYHDNIKNQDSAGQNISNWVIFRASRIAESLRNSSEKQIFLSRFSSFHSCIMHHLLKSNQALGGRENCSTFMIFYHHHTAKSQTSRLTSLFATIFLPIVPRPRVARSLSTFTKITAVGHERKHQSDLAEQNGGRRCLCYVIMFMDEDLYVILEICMRDLDGARPT